MKRNQKEYPIGIPICNNSEYSSLLSSGDIDQLKLVAKEAGHSLRVYISIVLKKYAVQKNNSAA